MDKYRWQDFGSSYLPSELNAAYLWAQLEMADAITADRLGSWNHYRERLSALECDGKIEWQIIPDYCEHNAHMFYIKLKDVDERTRFIDHMKTNDILTVFHYVPLHSAPAGLKYCRFHGEDRYTTKESERLVRLPLYYGLKPNDVDYICDKVEEFFR